MARRPLDDPDPMEAPRRPWRSESEAARPDRDSAHPSSATPHGQRRGRRRPATQVTVPSRRTDRRGGGARRRPRGRDRGRGARARGGAAQRADRPDRRAGRRPPDVEPGHLRRRRVRLRRPRRPAHRPRRRVAGGDPRSASGSSRPSRASRSSDAPSGAGSPAGRATIRTCHPPVDRPAPDPRPCSSHRPSASRWRPGCGRATSASSSGRNISSASADRSAGASPAATSSSLLLWGPPGTGKTSLARLLAAEIGAEFTSLSAVMSGVAEVRSTIAEAQERLTLHGGRTVLFLDEIHRFNKAQQDALLPHVEDGTVTLIGATTENPYFEVNSALLSRMRVWRLEPLTDDEVASVVRRALADADRGLAGSLGPSGRRRPHRRRLRASRLAGRWRRPRRAQRPRRRDRPGRGRGDPRRQGPRQPSPGGRRDGCPAAGPRLRPGR